MHFKYDHVMARIQDVGAFQVCQCYGMWPGGECISSLPLFKVCRQDVGTFQIC